MSDWVHYPCFALSLFPPSLVKTLKGFTGKYQIDVDLETLQKLLRTVTEFLPKQMYVGSGTGFGPYHVEEEFGNSGDFNLFSSSSIAATASAIERMANNNVKLPPSIEVVTKAPHKRSRGFRELEITRNVTAGQSMGLDARERCQGCGKFMLESHLSVPYKITLRRKSIPKNHDLYRWVEYDGMLFASERFVNAFHDLGLKGLKFEEVGLE